jgi:hypothetical protein
MADLLDIAPSTAVESVHIDGMHIAVRGLHGDAIASILSRFPQLASLISGSHLNLESKLMVQFGNAIAPIIAAGCGHLNDEQYERQAASLLVEDQLKLVKAIIGLTFPNGVTSFVTMIATTITAVLVGSDERAKPVKMRLKQSPSTSQPSSVADSPPTMQ